jgi:hypothetical protein
MWATSVIFETLHKVNNSTMGEFSPTPVTLMTKEKKVCSQK